MERCVGYVVNYTYDHTINNFFYFLSIRLKIGIFRQLPVQVTFWCVIKTGMLLTVAARSKARTLESWVRILLEV
jgi:hypothetical protein